MEYRILFDGDILKAYNLREEVFVHEQNVPIELEIDHKDCLDTTVHVGVFEGDNLIAVGRILDFGKSTVHIGRIAVKKDFRNSGVGRFLILNMEDTIRESNIKNIICELDAQIQVIGFYEKLGYLVLNDVVFLDAGIKHKTMYKNIK